MMGRAVGDGVITCLVCLEAWRLDFDPPKCENPEHPHCLNTWADGRTADGKPAALSDERSSAREGETDGAD